MSMLCPKCHNLMTQYERSGVVVDQCTGCKGLFLDRGELERLAGAERAWHTGYAADHGDRHDRHDRHDDDHRDDERYDAPRRSDDRRYGDDTYRPGHKPHKRRRGSFFEELFDFD